MKKLFFQALVFFALFFGVSFSSMAYSISKPMASWLYTMTELVEWTTRDPDDSVLICTIGKDKVNTYLQMIQREAIAKGEGKPFDVANKTPEDSFKGCYILYISDSEQEHYVDILEKINGYKGIVTVSSIRGFAKNGGILEFVIGKKKARPVLNLDKARKSKVLIKPKLRGWAGSVKN